MILPRFWTRNPTQILGAESCPESGSGILHRICARNPAKITARAFLEYWLKPAGIWARNPAQILNKKTCFFFGGIYKFIYAAENWASFLAQLLGMKTCPLFHCRRTICHKASGYDRGDPRYNLARVRTQNLSTGIRGQNLGTNPRPDSGREFADVGGGCSITLLSSYRFGVA